MKTPDGKQFNSGQSSKELVKTAAAALASALMMFLRAIWKLIITTWRLAAALDSALWRATKLLLRKAVNGTAYTLSLALQAFRNLLLWLPTRTGRAYSAFCGVMLAIAVLWIIDELRAGPGVAGSGQSHLRAPVDESDPILARIEGRYVHLSEIEAAARAGGFISEDDSLTPETAFQRELVRSFVEQRLLARAANDEGMQRAPQVSRRVNAARDRVLAAAFLDSRIRESVTPEKVERLYTSQKDVAVLGDQVRVRHILVESSEQANEILVLLAGGSDFGTLARERSLDRATAPLGGEVGWFSKIMMAPDFSKAAFATQPGELAPIFETEFGWHVMEILGRRSTGAIPFDDVRDSISEFLRLRAIERAILELERENQVVYFVPEEEGAEDTIAPPDLSAAALLDDSLPQSGEEVEEE